MVHRQVRGDTAVFRQERGDRVGHRQEDQGDQGAEAVRTGMNAISCPWILESDLACSELRITCWDAGSTAVILDG